MLDIYFAPSYAKLCELIDGGESCRFTLNSSFGQVVNQFIKRSVPFLIDDVQYYDIVTPYGYGGPVIISTNDHAKLIKEYESEFERYCLENNIICEFIRYHPILKNYDDFTTVYQNTFSRHTVGTNLGDYDDPVQSEFNKWARREIRRAEKAGITCAVNMHPVNLDVFRNLYEEAMDRNHAGEMYYFPDEYYRMLTTDLREYILEVQAQLNGEIIASEIYFISAGIMHAHLLGSSSKLLEVGGAILEATAARWGKENGYQYIHHGGGRSSDPEDSLYVYKKKFGTHTEFDFFTGKRVWNAAIYDKAVAKRAAMGLIENLSYFPAYRG